MNHRHLAACVALACSAIAAPVHAIERGVSESFADVLREAVEEQLSLREKSSDRSEAPWLHEQRLPEVAFEKMFDRPRFDWQHRELDDWPEALRRWGFEHDRSWHGRGWADPYCIPAVPEPSGLALMAGGLLAVALVRRRRR